MDRATTGSDAIVVTAVISDPAREALDAARQLVLRPVLEDPMHTGAKAAYADWLLANASEAWVPEEWRDRSRFILESIEISEKQPSRTWHLTKWARRAIERHLWPWRFPHSHNVYLN